MSGEGRGLMLNKMRSGSSMGGSFLQSHHNKGLKMSRQISTGSGALDPNTIYNQPLKLI